MHQGQNRAIEFVQGRAGGEGLMFTLPPGYRRVKSGQLPGGIPFQTYLPAGEPEGSRRLFLEVMAVPGAALSAKGVVTPEQILMVSAKGMLNVGCPNTFNASVLGPIQSALATRQGPPPAPNAPDFAVIIGCGRTSLGQSEVSLMASFRNGGDLFVLNWTERGAARDGGPVALDQRLWLSRLRELQPLRLCEAAKGRSGPSDACVLDMIGSIPTAP
jgi:hypothetical protein